MKWNEIKKTPLPKNQLILVIWENNELSYSITLFGKKSNKWLDMSEGGMFEDEDVERWTHWLPIPELP